ncbi:hypothetical protein JR316_0005076 [Psilocybe cubensis]|uniref:Uncharacterized protein n=2 Tax=Psilocybe cubensis TaxID=181762 RepID=A0A8H7Y1R8_PSICU|nr:hypothetical protein JR316_0005076 [Psilocybe cubensis]KAH9482976.1 hypothetical protein JR316_0005076 [Psilocybe cubensis]
MSVSVDDLVSCLSSNHIGQEANDIAVLQAQLAQTLFRDSSALDIQHEPQTPCSPRGRKLKVRACTTPTARTPSVSSNQGWGMAIDTSRSRRNSVSSSSLENLEEDEKMVEDLLIPATSLSDSLSDSHMGSVFLTYQDSQSSQANTNVEVFLPGYTSHNNFSDPFPSSPTTSLFTATDPFYLAQLESLNSPAAHPRSVFAQSACLNANSPFALSLQSDQPCLSTQSSGLAGNHPSMTFGAF